PYGGRDLVEARARVALAAERTDRLLDERVPADLAALPSHRSPPRRGLAASPDSAATPPPPAPPPPPRPAPPHPPGGAGLGEQFGHALLHPQRELLMGLAVTRVDRPPVPNADRRPPPRGPQPPLGHAGGR